jgi:hypothetical protein
MKIIFLVLLSIQFLYPNNLQISLDSKTQTINDIVFFEAMDSNTTTGYNHLSQTFKTSNINIKSNFNDMIGFNYTKTLNGITYDSKELYIGTSKMKYFAYNKIKRDIIYKNRDVEKDIDKFTLLNIFTITKEKMVSIKNETLDPLKVDLYPETNSSIKINREYNLETFTLSSENLYDIVEYDLNHGKEYLNPLMFSKKINPNFSIYGVTILSMVQHNYTTIYNYYTKQLGILPKQNISYLIKTKDDISILDTTKETVSTFFTSGKYYGYEYGYKVSAKYKIKNFSVVLTILSKSIDMKNKYNTEESAKNSTESHNILFYKNFNSVEKYIRLGLVYSF